MHSNVEKTGLVIEYEEFVLLENTEIDLPLNIWKQVWVL